MKNKTVYIVDDSEVFANMAAVSLEAHSEIKSRIFLSGEELLQNDISQADTIILDYTLDANNTGIMNGEEVLEKIRARAPKLPVIMLTGQEDMNSALRIMKKGANDYILKDELFFEALLKSMKSIFEFREMKDEIINLRGKTRKLTVRLSAAMSILVVTTLFLYLLFC